MRDDDLTLDVQRVRLDLRPIAGVVGSAPAPFGCDKIVLRRSSPIPASGLRVARLPSDGGASRYRQGQPGELHSQACQSRLPPREQRPTQPQDDCDQHYHVLHRGKAALIRK